MTAPKYNYDAPKYCPNAKATSIGWAHPTTGEQLVSRKGLPSPVEYYKPNAGKFSFVKPQNQGVVGAGEEQEGEDGDSDEQGDGEGQTGPGAPDQDEPQPPTPPPIRLEFKTTTVKGKVNSNFTKKIKIFDNPPKGDYTLTKGTIPNGCTINIDKQLGANGQVGTINLSGTPTQAGMSEISIRVNDGKNNADITIKFNIEEADNSPEEPSSPPPNNKPARLKPTNIIINKKVNDKINEMIYTVHDAEIVGLTKTYGKSESLFFVYEPYGGEDNQIGAIFLRGTTETPLPSEGISYNAKDKTGKTHHVNVDINVLKDTVPFRIKKESSYTATVGEPFNKTITIHDEEVKEITGNYTQNGVSLELVKEKGDDNQTAKLVLSGTPERENPFMSFDIRIKNLNNEETTSLIDLNVSPKPFSLESNEVTVQGRKDEDVSYAFEIKYFGNEITSIDRVEGYEPDEARIEFTSGNAGPDGSTGSIFPIGTPTSAFSNVAKYQVNSLSGESQQLIVNWNITE